MTPILAVLELTDFAVIAVIVVVFASMASMATRQQINIYRLERKVDALLQHLKIQMPSRVSPEVQRLARDPAQKIAAIKLHRQLNPGLGLAEAKAEVEEVGGQ